MNREDIVRMARQAGSLIEAAQEKDLLWLERFAALVASAGLTDVLDFIEEFTGAERERHPMFSDGYDLALSHVKELVEAKLKEKNSA